MWFHTLRVSLDARNLLDLPEYSDSVEGVAGCSFDSDCCKFGFSVENSLHFAATNIISFDIGT